MAELEIRPARTGDGAACARIWQDVGGYFTRLDPALYRLPDEDGLVGWFEQVIATLAGNEAALYLLALAGGEAVGSLSATVQQPVESAGRQLQSDLGRVRLHIDALGVLTGRRRAGVGSALMARAQAWGRLRGADVVYLEAMPSDSRAMAFYGRRLGLATASVTLRGEIP